MDIFRRFFEKIVEQCQDAGLVWGKELYIDATKVEANASLDSLTPRFAVEAHLAKVFAKEVVALTEQQMTQKQATASEPGEQAEGEVPRQLPVFLSQEDPASTMQSVMTGLSTWERKIAASLSPGINASPTYR